MDQEATYWRKQGVVLEPEMCSFFDCERRRRQNQKRSDERNQLTFTGRTALEDRWDGTDPVFEAVSKRMDSQQLKKVLSLLPEDERELLDGYYFQEQTMEQIGDSLGISRMAVSKRLKGILRRMRVLMAA